MDNKKIVTILALISVVFIGVSIYILSSLTKEDEKYLDTGSVILTYSDSFKNGNVMLIENALPVSDEVGKISNKEDTYFDFTVTASAVKKDIKYEIVVSKDSLSTLSDDDVKLYLTEIVSDSEKELDGANTIPTYAELNNTMDKTLSGKAIYFDTVKAGEVAYGRKFRLRIWVNSSNIDDYSDFVGKDYKIKVNVVEIN